jgi:hypothetical protein
MADESAGVLFGPPPTTVLMFCACAAQGANAAKRTNAKGARRRFASITCPEIFGGAGDRKLNPDSNFAQRLNTFMKYPASWMIHAGRAARFAQHERINIEASGKSDLLLTGRTALVKNTKCVKLSYREALGRGALIPPSSPLQMISMRWRNSARSCPKYASKPRPANSIGTFDAARPSFPEDEARPLSLGGAGGSRTHEWRFCRPLP